jgi:hypothetical protein
MIWPARTPDDWAMIVHNHLVSGGPGRPGDAGGIEALTAHLCAEQRLAGWYRACGARAVEPGLGRLFAGLASEASRRAAACATRLGGAVQVDPSALPGILRMALWMTRTGDPVPARDGGGVEETVPDGAGDRHCIQRMLSLYRALLAGPTPTV